jgi:hypothetical protein
MGASFPKLRATELAPMGHSYKTNLELQWNT